MTAALAALHSVSQGSPAVSQGALLSRLSEDCWSKVTAYLDRWDRRKASRASRQMKVFVLNGAALHDCRAVNECIALFRQKADLPSLGTELLAGKFSSLEQLDQAVLTKRMEMIEAMNALDSDIPFREIADKCAFSTPFELGGRNPFHLMHAIFQLWLIEKKMRIINGHDTPEKNEKLFWMARNLAAAGHFKRAIDVSKMLPLESPLVDELLQGIASDFLVPLGHFEQAIEIARTMTDPLKKDVALQNIFRGLIAARQLNRALAVAGMVGNESQQGLLIKEAAVMVASTGDIEKAFAISRTITDILVSGDATVEIARYPYRK